MVDKKVLVIKDHSSNYFHKTEKNRLNSDLEYDIVSSAKAFALGKLPCPNCFPEAFKETMAFINEEVVDVENTL